MLPVCLLEVVLYKLDVKKNKGGSSCVLISSRYVRSAHFCFFALTSLINRILVLTHCGNDLMVNLILLLQEYWQILLGSTATCSSSAVCLCPQLASSSWCLSTGWTDRVTTKGRGLSLNTTTIRNPELVWLLMLEATKCLYREGRSRTLILPLMFK